MAGVCEWFGVSSVSSVLAGYTYHNGLSIVGSIYLFNAGLVIHIIQTFVHTGEGYFCLQTTLSLRSTKQGSTEPGLYIYIYVQLTSSLYTPMSPRLCAKLAYPFMNFNRLSKHASAGNVAP